MQSNLNHIALIPFAPILGNIQININNVITIIQNMKTENNQLQLFILPELAISGYFLENLNEQTAITTESEVIKPLLHISINLNIEIIIGSVYTQNYNYYNAAFVIQNGEILFIHKKIYLPTYGLFDEKRDFKSGSELNFYNSILGKTSILICEDAFHPFLAYYLFVQKIQHVIVISASPCRGIDNPNQEIPNSVINWKERLKHYASNYGQFYYYINRSGTEDGIYFGGESFVFSPTNSEIQMSKNEYGYVVKIDNSIFKQAHYLNGALKEDNPQLHLQLLKKALKTNE